MLKCRLNSLKSKGRHQSIYIFNSLGKKKGVKTLHKYKAQNRIIIDWYYQFTEDQFRSLFL